MVGQVIAVLGQAMVVLVQVTKVALSVCVCARACVRACVRARARACVRAATIEANGTHDTYEH